MYLVNQNTHRLQVGTSPSTQKPAFSSARVNVFGNETVQIRSITFKFSTLNVATLVSHFSAQLRTLHPGLIFVLVNILRNMF